MPISLVTTVISNAIPVKNHLINHKYLHTHKGLNHHCEVCGKGLAFLSQLLAHKSVHTVDHKHVCDKRGCCRSFTHDGDLKKHQHTHMKNWWKCEVPGCNYKNKDECNLKSHQITHTTKKGFTYKYCMRKFQWSMQLMRHYESQVCICTKRSNSPSF